MSVGDFNFRGGYGITVTNSNPAVPYINMSNPSAGMVRYNGNFQGMEVYDGNIWQAINSNYSTVSLSGDVVELLEWARKKRNEEVELLKLAEEHPIIRSLMDEIKHKEDQLKMVQTLVKKEVSIATS